VPADPASTSSQVVDLRCHILPKVDGPATLDETLKMARLCVEDERADDLRGRAVQVLARLRADAVKKPHGK